MEQKIALVVDDEQEIRRLISTVLRDMQFRVIEASSGVSAAFALNREPRIDLLTTGHKMGKDNGIRGRDLILWAKNREKCPHAETIRTVLISGESNLPELLRQCRPHGFLGKPFTVQTLRETISKAIVEVPRPVS